jgi:cytochrome b pre-mRNA-processing protein 3
MSRPAEIISLASRRPARSTNPRPVEVETDPFHLEGSTEKGAWIVLVALLLLLAVGAVMAFVTNGAPRSLAGLAPAERTAVFRRAYEDLRETCRLPATSNGPLLERCRSTAAFVVLFPDCDAACSRAARALMPRARR